MAEGSYQQFCPVAMASEILCKRWTMLLLRELSCGSTRFNDLRRGLPRMSPALLSQRLKELEAAGIVTRVRGDGGAFDYRLTASGQELGPVVMALGAWGHRWIESAVSLEQLDASLLMWDMRRNLDPDPLPDRRVVIAFRYTDLPKTRRDWWLLVSPQGTDLCAVDPGFEVDLYAVTDLRTMTAIWMGMETVAAAKAAGRLTLTGDRKLASGMQTWLGLSKFAGEKRRVA